MKELKFITNGVPHHKPKVLFTCHPDDYGMALPLISEDILRHSNCVIWYSDEDSIFESQDEPEALLEDMQLLTVAVTDRFLSRPNEAKDVILPLVLSAHIPVLPIMLETGLESRFNEVCAKVQLVNRYVSDPTATPYDDVLKTFLNSVLVSDELAQKVRNAFDAYERLGDVIRKMSLDNIISSGQMWAQKYRGHLAGEDYQQAYEIRKELFETSGKPSARRDLSAILTKLGNLRMDNNDIDGAEEYYQRALEHDKILSEELKTNQSKDDYAVSLMKLGKIFRVKKNYTQAIGNYISAKEIYRGLKESSCLPRYRSNYAACCEKLASTYKHSGQPDKAEEEFLEAIAEREDMNTGMPDDSHALAVAYFNYAAFKEDKNYFKGTSKNS